jgi:Txe/YoeB family toxin of Txe-Axe toxin-antitoxin module
MDVAFTENGWEDFQYWIETDGAMVNKITLQIKNVLFFSVVFTTTETESRYSVQNHFSFME